MSSKGKSGILIHPTAFSSKYGIGDIGPEAYSFIDNLVKMGQSYWQILPIGPPDSSNSPYSLLSTFAGNPLLISIDVLVKDGLLFKHEIPKTIFSDSKVDFFKVKSFKNNIFKIVCKNFDTRSDDSFKKNFKNFCEKNMYWLDDYSEFSVIKQKTKYSTSWSTWSEYQNILDSEKKDVKILQFIFDLQWKRLRRYCNNRNIKIIGDMPIYVSYESVDVWKNNNLFSLNDDKSIKYMAGCPPCEYSKDGQLWGNPIYNWDEHKKANYQWWVNRFKRLYEMVDTIRLDHFIGFSKYWEVPSNSKNALNGRWKKGPGEDFFEKIKNKIPNMSIIAEDLGPTDDHVLNLRNEFNFPGMHVIQFDLKEEPEKIFFLENSVLYSGTHDNDTLLGWLSKDEMSIKIKEKYFKKSEINNWDIIDFILKQNSKLVIFQIQDLVFLDSSSRFNTPGTLSSRNWTWRLHQDQLKNEIINRMKKMVNLNNRLFTN
ncbi:MAG: 4-alpha-glucanotransferase [Candidatus Neomarinimicrobiota bacterium]|nr:4-alpha-glucanotransferase [Candidatus Neomarinimicrobiota bacterium]